MAKVKRLVLTGTANVYRADQAEASEESPFGPQSRVLYLASKAAQEWLAASMCNEHDIDHAILRISSVIGDGRSIIGHHGCRSDRRTRRAAALGAHREDDASATRC